MQLTVSNFIFTLNARLDFSSALSPSLVCVSTYVSGHFISLYSCSPSFLIPIANCTALPTWSVCLLKSAVKQTHKVALALGHRAKDSFSFHFGNRYITSTFGDVVSMSMSFQDLDQKYSTGCVLSWTKAFSSSSPRCFFVFSQSDVHIESFSTRLARTICFPRRPISILQCQKRPRSPLYRDRLIHGPRIG